MHCPSCGQENRSGRKFCAGCGTGLEASCRSCGTANEPDERFCGQCGAALFEAASPSRGPSSTSAAPFPASLASGRYQVQRFLGEGGKKRVYLARDSRLETDVAIALIKAEGLDPEGLTRVRREAQAMGRLRDDPHIVSVLDIGEENGQSYLVQEYMAGGSLEELLRGKEGHRLAIDEAIRIAAQVCGALAHAHGQGVIHRDLKPGNVWLAKDGTAKLGDFGLAVALDRSRLTRDGMMVGTASYMPPEQALGGDVTPRSDLYALGCVLYEMVSGRPPFLGDDTVAMISQHINTAPVAPSWHNPEVPRSLEALILRLLSKLPSDRPENAEAVADELRRIAERSTEETPVPAPVATEFLGFYSDVFVGRREEMEQLKAALEGALSGRGSLVMLVGEPGIGKTRLAEEFGVYASLRGVQVLTGHCYEGEVALPYRPFTESFRQYARGRPDIDLRRELGDGAPEVAKLVSEVRQRFPDLPESPPLEAEAERVRLFDSVATFLRNASNATPIVLVLDDLHWADKPSLLLMRHLARTIPDQRLLILGAYRDVELDRTHPLADVVATLRREQPYQRVLLRGLPQEDVLAFLSAIEPSEETVAGRQALAFALYQETEGNPFFIREVLAHLIEEGKIVHEGGRWVGRVTSPSELGIPEGVREVIGRRLSRLSEGCNRMLTVASAMTGGFSWEELKAICGEEESTLLDLLDEALAHQLLRERRAEHESKYDFTHALIRQTLYGELSTPRRVLLHRQIGQALEELYATNLDPHLGELAHHFYQAAPGGDVDKAIDYAARAGDCATEQVAWEEAATHYELALQALELAGQPDERRHCDLVLALCNSYQGTGAYQRALETAQQAATIARRLTSPEHLARAACAAHDAWVGENPLASADAVVSVLEEALGGVGEQDSATHADLLARLAAAQWLTAPQERLRELATQAVEMSRRLGHPRPESLGWAHTALGGPEHAELRLDISNEMIRLAEGARDARLTLSSHVARRVDLAELSDIAGMERDNDVALGLAEQLRWPAGLYFTRVNRAVRPLLEGRFDEAEGLIQAAFAAGQQTESDLPLMFFAAQFGDLRHLQGRLEELEEAAKGLTGDYPESRVFRLFVAFIYSETGRLDQALETFDQFAREGFATLPKDISWLIVVYLLTEICAVLDDAARASELYDIFLPYAARNVITGPPSLCTGSASRQLGMMATLMERYDDAERHFEHALAFDQKMDARPWVAHTQYNYARMLARRAAPGDRRRALELLAHALRTAHELGMKKIIERALALRVELQGIAGYDVKTSIDAVAVSVNAERPDLQPRAAPDGTVTLLFTDIKDSTPLNERLGDQRWMDILRVHNAIVRDQVAAHGGFEVKSQGDGFMVAFGSARRALQCAIALQRAIADQNRVADEPVSVRVGLHTGEAIREADDFYGHHVNLAARIANHARGGEILVSSLLKDLTERAGEFAFGDGREVELKGLTGSQRVFSAAWE